MNKTQESIAKKIRSNWPKASIKEYDAGCFSAVVAGDFTNVCRMFPADQYGVEIGRASSSPEHDGQLVIRF